MGKDAKSTKAYEAEKEISAEQAKRALAVAAQKRAADCQKEIDAALLKHDCWQYPIHVYKPAQPFWRIITEARTRP